MASGAIGILLLVFISVLSIVTTQRFKIEKQLRYKYGIDRDWWVPIIALTIALATTIVSFQTLVHTIITKIDIIVLIFTFGVLAEGLYTAGVFRYIAFTVVELCDGNTKKLVLGLFFTISAFTFFTTNDVVVLVVTPIILEIVQQAKIPTII